MSRNGDPEYLNRQSSRIVNMQSRIPGVLPESEQQSLRSVISLRVRPARQRAQKKGLPLFRTAP